MATNLPVSLRVYQAATRLLPLIAKRHIRKRLTKGKEHPTRWVERLGEATQDRPVGQLIWLHAVGLGEVMSLRGLVDALAARTDAHFLITSGTRAAAEALENNTPPRTMHQFLPLDTKRYRNAFLDHWRPDLCVWAEQDLWPGFVLDLTKRGIAQALVVARMTSHSAEKKSRFSGAFTYLYRQMTLLTAYDTATRQHLTRFGIPAAPITGSIKPTAPPLRHDPAALAALQSVLGDRFVWITAPSHPADEALALAAHRTLLKTDPDALLIIAPRDLTRRFDIPLAHAVRSQGTLPGPNHSVYLADTFGDLGVLYRVAKSAFIGGTNDAVAGHSPWEAANLNTAILHGPCVGNFAADYATLNAANAARQVTDADDLATALTQDMSDQIANANRVIATYHKATNALADDLLALL